MERHRTTWVVLVLAMAASCIMVAAVGAVLLPAPPAAYCQGGLAVWAGARSAG